MVMLLSLDEPHCPLDFDTVSPAEAAQLARALSHTLQGEVLSRAPWHDLELSMRAQNILRLHRIETIAELLRFTPTRLCALRTCGRRTVDEIRHQLQQLGLDLKPEPATAA